MVMKNGAPGGPPPSPPTTATPNGRTFTSFSDIANFLWSVADLLRGDYKQADYGKVILPMTVLRRLDCVLRDTKPKVLAKYEQVKGGKVQNLDPILNRITGVPFHNVSKFDFDKLKGDPNNVSHNLTNYIKGFSTDARDIFIDRIRFGDHIAKLDESNLLYQVVCRFAEVDLHPSSIPNHTMGLVFEELIRRFAEQSNETAGEHFTPREVIRLMVDLLFIEDDDALRRPGIVRSLYDPACEYLDKEMIIIGVLSAFSVGRTINLRDGADSQASWIDAKPLSSSTFRTVKEIHVVRESGHGRPPTGSASSRKPAIPLAVPRTPDLAPTKSLNPGVRPSRWHVRRRC